MPHLGGGDVNRDLFVRRLVEHHDEIDAGVRHCHRHALAERGVGNVKSVGAVLQNET